MSVRDPGRAERLHAVLERDGATCIWCGRAFGTLVPPTTEHVVPRVKGGPSWSENEVAACRRCNAERGHRAPADWLAECRGRGWCPDAARVVRTLTALEQAIALRGGQRRARPYLDAQLRRLRRAEAACPERVAPGSPRAQGVPATGTGRRRRKGDRWGRRDVARC